MHHLNNCGVAHRDIKPDNLLLDSNFNLKIADFGFANILESKDQLVTGIAGTPLYKAPEIQEDNEYNPIKADIFSLGVTLFIMALGRNPYGETSDDLFLAISEGKWAKFWAFHEEMEQDSRIDSSFKHVIENMLCVDPNKRMTLLELS